LQNGSFEHFFDEGLVERHLKPLKHGKEASVHLFRANPRTTGEDLVALKLYHPLDRRDFRDETLYRDGEFIKERRIRAALEKKTKFGRGRPCRPSTDGCPSHVPSSGPATRS
jgi:hypothetical protein